MPTSIPVAPARAATHDAPLLGATALLVLLVFVIDLVTPLGYAEWALYLVPIGLTLFGRRPLLPFAVAAVTSVGTLVGFAMSPSGINAEVALVNRGVGAATAWTLAVVVWQAVSARLKAQRLAWLQQGEAVLSQALLGELTPEQVGERTAQALCRVLGAEVGVLYRLEGDRLLRAGGHAVDPATLPAELPLAHGVAGAVAREQRARRVADVAETHLSAATLLGRSAPRQLLVAPITADAQVRGVVELGFLQADASGLDDALDLLHAVADNAGIALRTALERQRIAELLAETQRQSEELQAQQEELRVSNEELEEQSRALQESQARLEQQQQELEQTNVQLEEHTLLLQRQKAELEQAQSGLVASAQRLESASRYKSEFLANMSHELRTPLNSALILAKLLADNRDETLTPEQVKYAQAIYASNNDLLTLINDILDLSKIEAGHVGIAPEPVAVAQVVDGLRTTFEPLVRHKGLALHVAVDADAPAALVTDPQRLQQVLKNLLANAVKFTERGEVSLRVRAAGAGGVRFDVRDTGIGIARHQQEVIFEAFRQADGSTSRRFGGTGLGLSISRELARRLGGDIAVDSEPGRGSTFSVTLPRELRVEEAPAAAGPADAAAAAAEPAVPTQALPAGARAAPAFPAPAVPAPAVAAWDGASAATPPSPSPVPAAAPLPVPSAAAERRHPGRLILAVEDDPAFAAVLRDLAHEMHFDCAIAATAAEALVLARELQPSAVLLDVGLPDASGLSVLERLKRDPATRHVPVHMMSAHDRERTALELGAVGYMLKPAAREELQAAIGKLEQRLQQQVRRVLVVEDDAALRDNLRLLLGGERTEVVAVGRVAEALQALAAGTFDCMVMDLALPDGSGYELLEKMAAGDGVAFPPVIVYTGRALTRDEEQRLRRYSRSIIIKGARSPERLLDEVTLFLHSVEAALPADQQRLLKAARRRDAVLDGRRILLAEDDVRNIFALSSVFEPLGARLEIARNGREALELLEKGDIDLVLMDVMMPEMDGLTAMRRIRANPEWQQLPIIALTAKAMADDRERCLEAGANDYIAKPIDVEKLVSLTRVWCPK